MKLKGQTALITGASQGIGRGIAIALAQSGVNVGINYRSHLKEAEEVAAEVEKAGSQAVLLQGDVSDQKTVESMVSTMIEQFGRLDIAVSNAAYSDREPFYEADMDGFKKTIDVTLWGALYLVRAAAQQMIEQELDAHNFRGSILVVGSPHAHTPVPRAMAYNMAKAANEQMTKTAAIELAEHRVRVNQIVPGWTDTPGERKFATDETLEAAGRGIPMGRLGNIEEIGRVAVFLCEPESSYFTGSSILIDGGITLPWWANRGSAAPAG